MPIEAKKRNSASVKVFIGLSAASWTCEPLRLGRVADTPLVLLRRLALRLFYSAPAICRTLLLDEIIDEIFELGRIEIGDCPISEAAAGPINHVVAVDSLKIRRLRPC